MALAIVGISLALLIGADAPPDSLNPVAAFINAADVNDAAAMRAVLDPKATGFLKKVEGCYLRRVYIKDERKELIAAWMCPEGPDRSRVVIANVGVNRRNKVVVVLQGETVNNRPAPERTGSALAD